MEHSVEIKEELKKVEAMDHETMCRIWRFGCSGGKEYLSSNTVVGDAFHKRLWEHFGGFTPALSKSIGWG